MNMLEKTGKRRLLGVLLALCLAVGLLPMSVFAADQTIQVPVSIIVKQGGGNDTTC